MTDSTAPRAADPAYPAGAPGPGIWPGPGLAALIAAAAFALRLVARFRLSQPADLAERGGCMTPKQLRICVAVAERDHMTFASKASNLTQSATNAVSEKRHSATEAGVGAAVPSDLVVRRPLEAGHMRAVHTGLPQRAVGLLTLGPRHLTGAVSRLIEPAAAKEMEPARCYHP